MHVTSLFCREVILGFTDSKSEVKGEGKVVETEESKLGKQSHYVKGQKASGCWQRRQGKWPNILIHHSRQVRRDSKRSHKMVGSGRHHKNQWLLGIL